MATTHIRTCPLCEATCGLKIETEGSEIVSIRGDEEDPLSQGFLCPKAYGIKALHEDPDRLRSPLRKRADGSFEEVSWDEAFTTIQERLVPLLEEHGRDAVAVYGGNPSAHHLANLIYGPVMMRALGSKQIYTASTVDQMPKHVSAGLMFGHILSIPVPDIDRSDHLLILGANPLVSNGSLLTAPNMRGRIRALRERGGKVVVVDPRRTRTAEHADEHHFIRPGTDAHLLAAIAATLIEEDLADPGRLAEHLNGLEEVGELVAAFTPEAVAPVCGIEAGAIRRIARELAAADAAAVYGRIGTTVQEFGTLASWLVDVVNVLTGNLDREGGAMFTLAAAAQRNSTGRPGTGKGFAMGRWTSRTGHAEVNGELPVAALADEIEAPAGEGETPVRALITIAGNPLLSTPDSERLTRLVEGLDFVVSIDIYRNETTSRADVILPAPGPLEHSHYDLPLYQLAVHNVANYTPPTFEPEGIDEWQILLRLTGVLAGQGADADVEAVDEFTARTLVQREVNDAHSKLAGRDVDEIMRALEPRTGPERILDLLLRVGFYGDGFGADPDGLTLAKLEENPHGVDLGPHRERVPEVLRTPSGKIELAPGEIVADVERLRGSLKRAGGDGMVLIGRRQLRSNNSWMHNLKPLVKGKERCTMQVHPEDAERLGLAEGEAARVTSRAGCVEAPVEITDGVMPGVISIPHGWGHSAPEARMSVAAEHAGVNSNVLTDAKAMDPLSGNAVLNGIPVEVEPA